MHYTQKEMVGNIISKRRIFTFPGTGFNHHENSFFSSHFSTPVKCSNIFSEMRLNVTSEEKHINIAIWLSADRLTIYVTKCDMGS